MEQRNKCVYDRLLLERLLPNLVFNQFGQKYKRPIPKNEGATISFNRFNRLPVPKDSLVEGITPAGQALSTTTITAAVKEEGNFVLRTNWLDLVGLDDVIAETTELCAENAAETLEVRTRDIVAAGTNVYYVGGGVQRADVAAGNIFTGTEVRRIRQIMARNNVKPVSGAGTYIGWLHPDAAYDLKGSDEWREPNTYADPKNIFNGGIRPAA